VSRIIEYGKALRLPFSAKRDSFVRQKFTFILTSQAKRGFDLFLGSIIPNFVRPISSSPNAIMRSVAGSRISLDGGWPQTDCARLSASAS
jgi:hypothetical protein